MFRRIVHIRRRRQRLFKIPEDIQLEIFKCLTLDELAQTMQTSKKCMKLLHKHAYLNVCTGGMIPEVWQNAVYSSAWGVFVARNYLLVRCSKCLFERRYKKVTVCYSCKDSVCIYCIRRGKTSILRKKNRWCIRIYKFQQTLCEECGWLYEREPPPCLQQSDDMPNLSSLSLCQALKS